MSTSVWAGSEWRPSPRIAIWDGTSWAWNTPPPAEFPAFADSTSGSFTNSDVAALHLPDTLRLGDLVVSICASHSDTEPTPSARTFPSTPEPSSETEFDPLRAAHAATLAPTRLRLKTSMFQWTPDMGRSVSWRVSGKQDTNAIVMNLVYRKADTTKLPAEPVVDYQTAVNTDRISLQAGTDFQSLYVAVALSTDLTGNQWPEGFTAPREAMGRFGDLQVHLMTANTVGAPASPGILQLDATVQQLAVALITIPGKPNADGRGVWILGDQAASVLGKTTILE
ncbi:hypothetical protein ACFWXK_15525 [Streptomyces sp. NPDC059070]|uniref:hypothetical protein n=1 Tax=Streptomyces sp. NPDC059070 TaxID=3346713 RepID=UPI00367D6505